MAFLSRQFEHASSSAAATRLTQTQTHQRASAEFFFFPLLLTECFSTILVLVVNVSYYFV